MPLNLVDDTTPIIADDTPPKRHFTFDPADRIVREEERYAITGFGRQHWWRMERLGTVPRRIKLGPRRVGWLLSELLAWREGRAALRDQGTNDA